MLYILRRLLGPGEAPAPMTREERSALEDADLMLRYAAGDTEAFTPLWERHHRAVFRFIYRSVHQADRAEELTQEVFLRVVRNAARYEKSARFTTWLYTIARNLCIDESRRQRHRRATSLDQPLDAEGGGETRLDRVEDPHARSGGAERDRDRFRTALARAITTLPDEQREVFLLRHVENLRFHEIGEITGVSENTVKSRMRYALAALRAQLTDFDGLSFDDEEEKDVRGAP